MKQEKGLLAKLQEEEERKARESLAGEAIKGLSALLEDTSRREKASEWRAFFLSDVFLEEQQTEGFGRGLWQYLQQQTAMELGKLPIAFLSELMIAYGLSVERAETAGNFDFWKASDPEAVIMQLWELQGDGQGEGLYPTRIRRLLAKPKNIARIRSFLDYFSICRMSRNGELTERNRFALEQVLVYGGRKGLMVGIASDANQRNEDVLNFIFHFLLKKRKKIQSFK